MAKKELAFKVTVDTSEVEGNVERSTESVEALGDTAKKTGNEMKAGFKSAEQGTKKLGTSIGGLIKSLGIIGAAMAVFSFMKDILLKNQKVMDALNVATTALEVLFMKLFEAVEPIGGVMKSAFEDPKQAVVDLWAVIKENLINRAEGLIATFKIVGKVIMDVLTLDFDAIKEDTEGLGTALAQAATGLDAVQQAAALQGIKDFAKNVAEATTNSIDLASTLVNLRNEVTLLEAEQRKLMLVYQNEAELQRQIRDDISITIEERIAANERLGEILDEQSQKEEAIALRRLELAQLELSTNRSSIELQAALIDAETELADVRERINGQRSEQLVNEKALEKELFDFQQELRVIGLEERELELEELQAHFDHLAEIAALAGEQEYEVGLARKQAIADLNEKFRKEDLASAKKAAKAKADAEDKISKARLQAAGDTAGALGTIAGVLEQQGKEGLIASKVITVAQIAIDTAKAISGAIAQAQSVPFPGNIAAIAVGVAAVVAGIASAVSTLNSANVPGPSATTPSVNVPSTSAPTIQGVTTNTTELGNTEQADLQPIQAFVIESDISGSQANTEQIESQAIFGG